MAHPHLLHSVSLAFAATLLLGCASTGGGSTGSGEDALTAGGDAPTVKRLGGIEPTPYEEDQLRIERDRRRTAGLLLAEIDRSLRAWNNIVLDGRVSQDLTRLDLLESTLRHDVRTNHDLLVNQLQTGPPINRQIAAAALGFSNSPESLGPLLGALQDTEEQVVANALLGLSTLHSPKTQTGSIATLFSDTTRSVAIRSNAGRTLRALPLGSLDEAGRTQVIEAARLSLGDEEAAVRVHACLILAQVVDTGAIERMSRLLTDTSPLVARAASRSIARIGSIDPNLKGSAARALTTYMDKVDRETVRKSLMDDLQRMAQVNYGSDTDAWLKYAHRLP
ncbi:MAG: HEAT repeat domain-containing protein [Planctomycetota bacterium]